MKYLDDFVVGAIRYKISQFAREILHFNFYSGEN